MHLSFVSMTPMVPGNSGAFNYFLKNSCKTGIAWRFTLYLILTHLAYIANGKKRVILCNNFTGRISVTLLCGICDVSYPTKQC